MIKQVGLILIFCGYCSLSKAQTRQELISVNLEKVPMAQFIKDIERKTSYKFYYLNSWIDSLIVNVNTENKSIREIITIALNGTKLQSYIDDNRIILTDNTPILVGIDPTFFSTSPTDSSSEANYSFRREYVPTVRTEAKVENKIIEIGLKQSTTKGSPTLVGYIKEKKTNEAISGAQIYIDKTTRGTTSNPAGFYSLSLPQGKYSLIVQYTGMNQEKREIILYSDGKLDISMEEDVISLKEVLVESERDANIANNQMGKSTIDMKSIKNVPKVLGENDILRVALTLPGVKSVGEGASGLNVRGGNADQNLMQLNEAPIYNSSHFLGFFSVFNADVIKTSELYKSGIPAQYGGRLSSIFDIQMKDGNQNKFSGTGGIGPVTARLTLEVPLKNEKTSIIFGGRSTYSDWILKQIPSSTLKNSSASFYDLVGRLTHKFNENNSIAISYYYSKDNFKLGNDSLFSYSNSLASLQWRSSFNRNLHSLLSVTHSEYAYNIDYEKVPQNAFNLGFGIKESNVKWDFNLYRGSHKIDFGLQSKLYDLNPGFINANGGGSLVKSDQVQLERGLESALYVGDNIEITPKLSVYLGLRFSSFTALGARNIYSYEAGRPKDNSTITDSTAYGNNQSVMTYQGPEYRFSARYSLPSQSSIKISYNRTRQYIHMLSNTVSVSPTTTWKLSDPNLLPQLGDQISLGYYKDFSNSSIEASAEVYYKWLDNVVDYKIGSELILNKHIEQDVLQGKGKAYGIEFLVRKKRGKLNGWLSYSYSRTFLQMDGQFDTEKINNGNYYPASYDKPHDVSIVMNYKFTRRYSFSSNFAYNTGRPITYPVSQYQFGGGYKINYSDRNEFRIPDYFRLDIGINIEGNHKIKNFTHSFWSISIYNVLGIKNPYSIYFKSENGVINGYKLSIFGAPIPTITYNFKF
jgi:CarboxypepD_reg-like domain/TonB-dependent Receptor Plug Domain